jgi:hypothetical protein
MEHRCLIQDAGWIAAREKPVAPGGKISPCRVAPDIHAPWQRGYTAQHQIPQGRFGTRHKRSARRVILARVKPILNERFKAARKLILRSRGGGAGMTRKARGKPRRGGAQHEASARESL